MKHYFYLILLVLILCVGCGDQQTTALPMTSPHLTDAVSPAAAALETAATDAATTGANAPAPTGKSFVKNYYKNTIFATKNYLYSTDGRGILQSPIVKSKTGEFFCPKSKEHYVINSKNTTDFTISDMYVTNSYLFIVESDVEATILWRIPFCRSGSKETLHWKDRQKVYSLDETDDEGYRTVDWEDFLYADDDTVVFSTDRDGIHGIHLRTGKDIKLLKNINSSITVDEYGVPRKYNDSIYVISNSSLFRISIKDFSVKKICKKVTSLSYYAPEEDVPVHLFPTTVHKNHLYFLRKDERIQSPF